MRINKYQKMAKEAPNKILIEDIEYGIRANNNAKCAIYSSISRGTLWVDQGYIKEKLNSVIDIDKWLQYYVKEAQERIEVWSLSMLDMQRFQDAMQSAKTLFKN